MQLSKFRRIDALIVAQEIKQEKWLHVVLGLEGVIEIVFVRYIEGDSAELACNFKFDAVWNFVLIFMVGILMKTYEAFIFRKWLT